jgi:hypothetical protein
MQLVTDKRVSDGPVSEMSNRFKAGNNDEVEMMFNGTKYLVLFNNRNADSYIMREL